MSNKYKRKHVPTVASTILFKFTKTENEKINIPFRHSLSRMKEGIGDQTDWFNIIFRVKCALIITTDNYEEVTVEELNGVYEICERLEARARENEHRVWLATEDEIEWLEAAFDVVEELQVTMNRKYYYNVCVKANYEIREKYVAGNKWKQGVKKPT